MILLVFYHTALGQNNLLLNHSFEEKLRFNNIVTLYNFHTDSEVILQNDTFFWGGDYEIKNADIIAMHWNYTDSSFRGIQSNASFSREGRVRIGNCYKIICVVDTSLSKLEYSIYNTVGTLCQPLTKGHQYQVSFYVKPFSGNHFTKSIGTMFIDTPYTANPGVNKKHKKSYEPLPKSYDWAMPEILKDTTQYTRYEFIYTATGGEQYLYIGNILFETPNYFSKKLWKEYFEKTKQYGYAKNRIHSCAGMQ